jgi:hypothetical protein
MYAEAKIYFKMVREALQKSKSGDTPMQKLKPVTLYARRYRSPGAGNKPLRETNELFKALKITGPNSDGSYFVGFKFDEVGNYRGRAWDPIMKLAKIHEFGEQILIDTRKLTPEKRKKMLAFMWIMLREWGVFTPSGRRSKKKLFQRAADAMSKPGIIIINIPPRPFLQPTFDKYLQARAEAEARVQASVTASLQKLFQTI